MDLGAVGRDNTFGSGLVDTGRAVRRAVALARDPKLAALATSFNPLPTNVLVQGNLVATRTPIGVVATPPEVGNNSASKWNSPNVDFAHLSKPLVLLESVNKVTTRNVEFRSSSEMELDLAFSTVGDAENVVESHADVSITMQGIDDVLSECFA